MIKKAAIFIILVSCVLLSAKGIRINSDLNLGFSYDSNVIRLAEDDKDEFLDKENPDKYKIEALDDLILKMNYSLKLKNYWLGGHTQVWQLKFNFDKYLENSVKDNGYVGLGIKQYFSKSFDTAFSYRYYPDLYVRQYRSVLDDEYHEYAYARNFYELKLNWDWNEAISWTGDLEYSQLFFNEWFTEYDAGIITANALLSYKPVKNTSITARYGYRVADADADDAFDNPEEIEVIKDASYESNIYALDLKLRKIMRNCTLNLGYKLETRYYGSEFDGDDYHIARDDYIHLMSAGFYKPLNKKMSMVVSAEYGFRDTDSPYDYVITDKEYNYWESGISFSYDLTLK